jgi:DNA-binding LytR/AlgR family response regulator
MKIIILEDEAPALRRIIRLLNDVDPYIEILGTAESIEEAKVLFETHTEVSLAIMDIELADGKSFELFQLMHITWPVIFTTAYDEYAIRAFKLNSIDYLLKPIESSELKAAIQKYKTVFENKTDKLNLSHLNLERILLEAVYNKTSFKTRFLVKSGLKYISLKTEDIAYFKAADKVITLVSRENNKYIIDNTLEELKLQLDPQHFFHINRQYIAHIQSVHSIQSYFNGKLKIKLDPFTDDEVIVSREKSAAFRAWMGG